MPKLFKNAVEKRFCQSCAAFGETLLKDAVPLDVLMKKEFLEPGSVSLDA